MRRGLIAIVISILFAFSAGATPTWWWVDGSTDDLWDTNDNWLDTSETPNEGPPPNDEDAYITNSDHLDTDPTALIESGVDVDHPTLYIGGWLSTFDTEPSEDPHGDPHGRYGVLNITGGELHADSPNCRYMRLGTRGARGTVNQSGGLYTNCQAIALAYVGEDGVGFYNLSGGTVEPFGFDVGGQGTGIVDMTGGTIDSVISGSPTRSTRIGVGVTHPDADRYQPGVGAFLLSGGTFKPENLRAGDSTGATGVLTIRGDTSGTTFEVLDDNDTSSDGVVFVGVYGVGSVVQSGGDTDIRSLILGRRPGSFGVYAITGGDLDVEANLRVGDAGTGSLVVGGGSVSVGNYYQEAGSRLTFIVNDTTPMVPTIQVSGSASIPDGSVIDIDFANDYGTGYLVGTYDPILPSCDQELTLLEAQSITGPSSGWESLLEPEGYGLPDDADEWDLAVEDLGATEALVATYVGQGEVTGGPRCP